MTKVPSILLPGWKHILTNGGVNSPEANSYFILATPVMVLVDARKRTKLLQCRKLLRSWQEVLK